MASGAFTGKTLTGPAEYQHVGDRMYLRAPDGQLYKPSQVPGWLEGMMIDAYGDLFTPPPDAVRAGPTEYGADGSIFRTTAGGEKQYQWNNAFSGWDGTSFAAPGDQQTMWSATQPTLADAAVPAGYNGNNPWGMATTRTSDFLTPSDIAIIGSMAAVPFGVGAMTGALGAGAGVTAADMAAGMMPQFGTTAAYNAGIGGMGGAASGALTGTSADFLFPGEADVFNGATHLGTGTGTAGWTTGTTSLPTNWGSTVDVAGQLPLYSFPGQTASLGGLGASLGLRDAAAAKSVFGGNGTGTGNASPTLAQLLGATVPAGLGYLASESQASTIRDLANQSRADRLPFLNAANQWLTDPQSYYSGPGAAALKANLHALSASYGNPYDSPNAMALATEAGMRDWRNAVTGFGNIGLGGQSIQADLGLRAVDADSNKWNSLGVGAANVGDIFTPRRTLADILGEAFSNRGTGGFSLA